VGRRPIAEELRQKMVWYYFSTDMTASAIARRFGVSQTTVINLTNDPVYTKPYRKQENRVRPTRQYREMLRE
jgi:transposase